MALLNAIVQQLSTLLDGDEFEGNEEAGTLHVLALLVHGQVPYLGEREGTKLRSLVGSPDLKKKSRTSFPGIVFR